MLFSDINPHIRFAHYFTIGKTNHIDEVVPVDARLFYTFSGNGKIIVKNIEYEMPPNALLIINSGIPYELVTPDKSVTYIAINFDYTHNSYSINTPVMPVYPANYKKDMLLDHNTFEDTKVLSDVMYINNIDKIHLKLTSIVDEYMQKLLYYEQKINHTLAECFAESRRYLELGNFANEKESGRQILAHIHENYNKKLTNQSIGEIFGYHPNYVSHLIKRITGMPIHQYLLNVRLINSVTLLENSNMSIDEISVACGFYDLAYFSKYFKKYFGVTPSKYRQN